MKKKNQRKDKNDLKQRPLSAEWSLSGPAVEEQTVAPAPEKVVVLVIEKGERPGVRETYESAGEGLLTVQPLCLVSRPR